MVCLEMVLVEMVVMVEMVVKVDLEELEMDLAMEKILKFPSTSRC